MHSHTSNLIWASVRPPWRCSSTSPQRTGEERLKRAGRRRKLIISSCSDLETIRLIIWLLWSPHVSLSHTHTQSFQSSPTPTYIVFETYGDFVERMRSLKSARRRESRVRARERERLKGNIRRNDRVASVTRLRTVYFGPSLISPHIGRVEMIFFHCLFLCGFLLAPFWSWLCESFCFVCPLFASSKISEPNLSTIIGCHVASTSQCGILCFSFKYFLSRSHTILKHFTAIHLFS